MSHGAIQKSLGRARAIINYDYYLLDTVYYDISDASGTRLRRGRKFQFLSRRFQ